ncbi:MAG: OprD family outer membrane porin [Crocinitomicaceae bacterium]|nr:OprD family outer membrane porin [Crocinitomicaceae bacterium]
MKLKFNPFFLSFTILLLNTCVPVWAQHHELSDQPVMWKGKPQDVMDSTSLLYAFKTGTTAGHFRYFLSQTTNEGKLSDYYANAIGGGLRFETNSYRHFQFAVSGFYFFNIGSSQLHDPDPLTGALSRYEIGLFDVENPDNHEDMDRLEELYLKYNLKKGHLILGKQLINTPLINIQDGRMRGTGVEGLWFDQQLAKKWRFQGGVLTAISPRSTTKWYKGAESIGMYSQGVNPDGTPSNFKGHIELPYVAVASFTWKPSQNLEYQAWDYHLPGLFNSTFHQAVHHSKFKHLKWQNGAQLMRQWALADGGNENQSMTYIAKGAKSLTFGFRSELEFAKWHYSLNYNRITAEGRYLFPREWGRDPFFTFMPRERNEGFGDVHAFVFKIENQDPSSIWRKSGFSFGYFQLPDVKDFALNKYGMPSYLQANLDLRVKLEQLMQGLEGQILFVCKYGIGETYNNPKYEFNKVNMLLTNFVLNYHF